MPSEVSSNLARYDGMRYGLRVMPPAGVPQTAANMMAYYHTCTEEAAQEVKVNARPELTQYLDNIDSYDNVFVCGPCWWGTFPMPVFSQIERLDFTSKKVMVPMTHEGSGLGSSERDLRKMCKGATFGNGMAVHGADSAKAEKAVAAWAKKNVEE